MFTRLSRIAKIGAALSLIIALSASPTYAEANLGLPLGDAESLGLSQEKLDAIPKALSGFIDKNQVPGFVTVVAKEGKIVHFEAFGKRDVERDKPMEKDTIFRMYSMTKPVTGTAVMILVQEGKLSVDDLVSKYIPEFKNLTVLETKADGSTEIVPADKPITIKQLLTHTSGLSYFFIESPVTELYGESDHNDPGISLEEYAKRVAKLPLIAHPGTAWNYSISMDILGRVVEVISGQRYGDFLDERIFKPLKMKDAGFFVQESEVDRFAANYAPTPKKDGMTLVDDPVNSAYLTLPGLDAGGAGLLCTASDYLRFAQMLLNGGELDGVRILKEESVREMTSDQLDPALGKSPLGALIPVMVEGIGFGYTGAVIREGYTTTAFGGAGQYTWGGAASTDFWIDKENDLVGLICTQLMPSGTYMQRFTFHNAVYAAVK
ncbi:MAG: serine hydrolase domain-containing protein [Candidatus Hydrogenedentota bacterium]